MSKNVVQSDNGTKYYLDSILSAISEFNNKCPKKGGRIIREHVGHVNGITHTTHLLKYKDNKLFARIECPTEIKNIKPIISVPLDFESGTEIKSVIEFINILIED